MKTWQFNHEGNTIRVINELTRERLYVNGELQDERSGLACSSRLYGEIKDGDCDGDSIKVSLGGFWTIGCVVFVDDCEVYRSA
jgi:hypothetical protein